MNWFFWLLVVFFAYSACVSVSALGEYRPALPLKTQDLVRKVSIVICTFIIIGILVYA